ncbi:hypothetical protein Athai_43380 [Actinocatenispora thailandica]|uniref:Uncharacterized protein n=1 Tax=Actinocatenispora thailandica TaxID=227318 RepID=A0A7R7DS29_9ACTN|nr:hypothetical protein [Actinocatenispora thailandica]BCJ36835.1 hypothetical protein Athai_43380 [Actinocatenispora thailandica]
MQGQTITRAGADDEVPDDPPVRRLAPRGRWIRVAVALAGAALLLVGTLAGQDDDFPFGPFRMYATADKLNAPVHDTRLHAVDAAGRQLRLTDEQTGFRRAELEGQLPRIRRHPELLGAIATAYHRRQPGAPRLVRIDVVVRLLALRDGRPTGSYTERTEATWRAR